MLLTTDYHFDFSQLWTDLNNGGFGEPFGHERDTIAEAVVREQAWLVEERDGVALVRRGTQAYLVADALGPWAVEITDQDLEEWA